MSVVEVYDSSHPGGPFCTSLVVDQARVDVCFLPIWENSMRTLLQRVRDLVAHVLQRGMIKRPFILDCVFSNDAEVCALNERYRGKKSSTNVLSFPQNHPTQTEGTEGKADVSFLLGSIILAHETVTREAEEANKSLTHHCLHLVLHGILHLLGFDHRTPLQAQEMEDTERRILTSMNLPDPYRFERGGLC